MGIPREKILQSITWVANVENNHNVYEKWISKIRERKPNIGKIHFSFEKKNYYIIFEVHPVFDNVDYVGTTGIFLNVEKIAWQMFNESEFKQEEFFNS